MQGGQEAGRGAGRSKAWPPASASTSSIVVFSSFSFSLMLLLLPSLSPSLFLPTLFFNSLTGGTASGVRSARARSGTSTLVRARERRARRRRHRRRRRRQRTTARRKKRKKHGSSLLSPSRSIVSPFSSTNERSNRVVRPCSSSFPGRREQERRAWCSMATTFQRASASRWSLSAAAESSSPPLLHLLLLLSHSLFHSNATTTTTPLTGTHMQTGEEVGIKLVRSRREREMKKERRRHLSRSRPPIRRRAPLSLSLPLLSPSSPFLASPSPTPTKTGMEALEAPAAALRVQALQNPPGRA